MKQLLFTLPLFCSFSLLAGDYDAQKAHCVSAASIVKNQDYDAFKQLVPLKIKGEEQAIKRLVDKQNKKYTKSRYAGISNFTIKDYELVADPKSHKVMAVRSNVEKWQASQVLKVNYTFDTRSVRTDKEQSVGGYCLFALVDNAWYMTNLLK